MPASCRAYPASNGFLPPLTGSAAGGSPSRRLLAFARGLPAGGRASRSGPYPGRPFGYVMICHEGTVRCHDLSWPAMQTAHIRQPFRACGHRLGPDIPSGLPGFRFSASGSPLDPSSFRSRRRAERGEHCRWRRRRAERGEHCRWRRRRAERGEHCRWRRRRAERGEHCRWRCRPVPRRGGTLIRAYRGRACRAGAVRTPDCTCEPARASRSQGALLPSVPSVVSCAGAGATKSGFGCRFPVCSCFILISLYRIASPSGTNFRVFLP